MKRFWNSVRVKVPLSLRLVLLVVTVLVALPTIASAVTDGGSAQRAELPPGVHLELGKRPPQAVLDAAAPTEAYIESCAPWGHPECVWDPHPPGNYFQPYCACNGGPAFACCNGHGQPCA